MEKKEEEKMMKRTILLTALLLCGAPAFARGGDPKLPFDKQVSAEKLILTERYRSALEQCRERSRKKAKETCIAQKRNEFGRLIADLEGDPRGYFAAKERNAKTGKELQEADFPRPRQKP